MNSSSHRRDLNSQFDRSGKLNQAVSFSGVEVQEDDPNSPDNEGTQGEDLVDDLRSPNNFESIKQNSVQYNNEKQSQRILDGQFTNSPTKNNKLNNDINDIIRAANHIKSQEDADKDDKSCNTVTVTQQKTVGGMNFQFISVSPSKKQAIDKNLIKQFKSIQEAELKTWRGLNVKFTSRPGNAEQPTSNQGAVQRTSESSSQVNYTSSGMNLGSGMGGNHAGETNQTISGGGHGSGAANMGGFAAGAGQQGSVPGRKFSNMNNFIEEQKQYSKVEEKRFRCLLDLMLKYRDWEEERIKIQLMQGSNATGSTGVPPSQHLSSVSHGADGYGPDQSNMSSHMQGYNSNFLPNMEQYASQSAQQQFQNIQNNIKAEFVNFKPLKDSSVLIRDGQSTIYFQKGAILNSFMNDNNADMYFKLIKCEAKLLRSVLEVNGFQQTESHDWNILWSSQSYKQYIYDNLNEYQKINHFPNSFELTRKDRLCANIVKMQEKFGKEAFDIIPDTYNLPDEFADFYGHFHQLRQNQDTQSKGARNENAWIIKPTNSSQGKGIFIIDDISEVPIDEPCIVSRYVANPLLINGLKFDVRIYVVITSMDPWRIYVYNEGLARFACDEYNPSNIKSNKFAHLTNYSINKKNEKFVQNQNADQGDEGHKWSLQALSKQFEQMGIDNDLLWSKIYDVILKSLIAVDGAIQQQLKKITSKNSCFELLGFDVLIDSNLKPWLMEVNLSPSLACDSPIDLKIKHALFLDTMNLICLKKFDRRRENLNKMKQRAKNIIRAKSYQTRSNISNSNTNVATSKADKNLNSQQMPSVAQQTNSFNQISLNNKLVLEKLQNIQPKYKDDLRDTLQEQFRRNGFLRIYPSKNSNIYDKYFGAAPKDNSQNPNSQNSQNSSFLVNSQTPNTASNHSSAVSASRASNRMLYKLMFTDEVVPYINHAQMKKFARTISRYQQLQPTTPSQTQSNQSSSNSFAALGNKESNASILNEGMGQSPDNMDALGSNKKSYQKLGKIQGAKGSLSGQQLSHQNQQTPQKLYMGKRDKAGAAIQFERQGKQQLLPALNVNPQSAQSGHHQSQNSALLLGGTQGSSGSAGNQQQKKEKLLITGDDILIEYVARLMIAVKSIKENMLKAQWIYQIEKFIKHSVWHGSDVRRAQNNKLWQRLESRLIEMKERRKRLLQSLYKKELKTFQEAASLNLMNLGCQGGGFSASRQAHQAELEQFQKEYKFREEQKNVIIQGFSAQQLEDMLHTSTKNVAYEVISCLIWIDTTGGSTSQSGNDKMLMGQKQGPGIGQPNNTGGAQSGCKGVLTDIIKWLTMTNQHQMLNDVQFSILDQISTKQNRLDRSGSKKQNNSYGNKNFGTAAMKTRKNNMKQIGGIRSKYSNTFGQEHYLGSQIEDDTESYQQQVSRSGVRSKHEGSQKSNEMILNNQDDINTNRDVDADQSGNSFKKLELQNILHKKGNPNSIIDGAASGGTNEGSEYVYSTERRPESLYRNMASPNTRHQLNTPSIVNNDSTDPSSVRCGTDSVSTTAQELGSITNPTLANLRQQYLPSSSNGKLYDSSVSSGLKSLQSTSKKNRIIINDELRSQHLREQQQMIFQSNLDQKFDKIQSISTMNAPTFGDGIMAGKDISNFNVENLNMETSEDLNCRQLNSEDRKSSTQNQIFDNPNELNTSNREHILVSDLSANDDSQSITNKEVLNADIDNINEVHDLKSNNKINDNLKRRHSYKPEKSQLKNKISTIQSEVSLKSGNDYAAIEVSNLDEQGRDPNTDQQFVQSNSKLKNQATFDNRRKNSKGVITNQTSQYLHDKEGQLITSSKSTIKVASNYSGKGNQKATIVLNKNMINFSANSQSHPSPNQQEMNDKPNDQQQQPSSSPECPSSQKQNPTSQIKSQLISKNQGQQQNQPSTQQQYNNSNNATVTSNSVNNSQSIRNKQQRQTPKNCRSKLTSHNSVAKHKNRKE